MNKIISNALQSAHNFVMYHWNRMYFFCVPLGDIAIKTQRTWYIRTTSFQIERAKKNGCRVFAKFDMVVKWNFQCAMTTLLICYKKIQKVRTKWTAFCLDENTNSHENALWYLVNFASQKYFNLIIACMYVRVRCAQHHHRTAVYIRRVICDGGGIGDVHATHSKCMAERKKKKKRVNERASTKLFLYVMYSCNRK